MKKPKEEFLKMHRDQQPQRQQLNGSARHCFVPPPVCKGKRMNKVKRKVKKQLFLEEVSWCKEPGEQEVSVSGYGTIFRRSMKIPPRGMSSQQPAPALKLMRCKKRSKRLKAQILKQPPPKLEIPGQEHPGRKDEERLVIVTRRLFVSPEDTKKNNVLSKNNVAALKKYKEMSKRREEQEVLSQLQVKEVKVKEKKRVPKLRKGGARILALPAHQVLGSRDPGARGRINSVKKLKKKRMSVEPFFVFSTC